MVLDDSRSLTATVALFHRRLVAVAGLVGCLTHVWTEEVENLTKVKAEVKL